MRRLLEKLKKSQTFKNFLAVVSSNLALRPVQLIKEYMVARYLGPSDYGLLKSIELINMMNKYGSLGYKAVAIREAGDALGKGDPELAERLKGYSYAGELILTGVLFIVGLCSSVFFDDYRVSLLIIFASFSFFVSKMSGLFSNNAVINKEFYPLSKIRFVAGLIASLIVIALVPFLEIYIVILMQFIVGFITIISFYYKYGYRLIFNFDLHEIKRVTKIGLPLTGNILLLGSFKYAERILIISFLGTASLGIYSFGLAMSDQLLSLFKLVRQVRAKDIFDLLGRGELSKTHKLVMRETGLLLVIIALIYPFYYLAIDFIIPLVLPEWTDAIFYAQVLYLIIPLESSTMYLTLVLSSSAINQQNVLPLARIFSVGGFFAMAGILYSTSAMSLVNISLVIIASYFLFSASIIYYYSTKFYRVYIKTH